MFPPLLPTESFMAEGVASAKMTWPNEKRKRIMSAIRADLMSSEEEVSFGDETVFMVKTLPWRSAKQRHR